MLYPRKWYSILEQSKRNELFFERLSRADIDGFRHTLDSLQLEFTKEQVLKFISDLYDNADAALYDGPGGANTPHTRK